MKKLIFTSLIAIISFSTFAQGNSQKNKNQNTVSKRDKEHENRYENRKDKDNDDRYENRKDKNNDDRYDDRKDKNKNERNDDLKFSKNTPRKVGDAFRRDYPNATNVTWTKNRGNWTANFGGGGIIGHTTTVTYKANGQRISSNGIFR